MVNYPTSFPSDAALRLVNLVRNGQLTQKRDEAGLYAWNVAGYGLGVGLGVPSGSGGMLFGAGGGKPNQPPAMHDPKKTKEEAAARSFPDERNLTIAEKAAEARTVKSPPDPSHTDPNTRSRRAGGGEVVEHLTTGEIVIDKAQPGGGHLVSAADAAAGHTQRPADDSGLPHHITQEDLNGGSATDPKQPVNAQVGSETGAPDGRDQAAARQSDKVRHEEGEDPNAPKPVNQPPGDASSVKQEGQSGTFTAQDQTAGKDQASKQDQSAKPGDKKDQGAPKGQTFKAGQFDESNAPSDPTAKDHPALDQLEAAANSDGSSEHMMAFDWTQLGMWALDILRYLQSQKAKA